MTSSVRRNITNQINKQIVPRWEWRTFGEEFPETEKILQSLECTRVKHSEEIYILSSNSQNNCKIRNSLMDIKVVEQIDSDGLEQWKPLLKASFPISFEIVRLVLRTLHVRKPLVLRSQYTHHQFLHEIVREHPKLKPVDIKKKRNGYLFEGVEVEMAELEIGHKRIKTIGAESEDPLKVQKILKLLHLQNLPNINYIKALKKLNGY